MKTDTADKKQFLAQTARPVTISGLTAQDVKVRILGDVAIIHARTSYTTADGEQRYSRHTAGVTCLAVIPGTDQVISGGRDQMLRICQFDTVDPGRRSPPGA